MTTVLFTKTCGRDLPLAKYQAALIAKHWKNRPPHVWVVDSAGEAQVLRQQLSAVFKPECDAIVLLEEHLGGEPALNGYLGQQVVKLLAPWYCATASVDCDATFQIDADCMPSAPFDWETLTPVWRAHDHIVWPVAHVEPLIPKWNKLSRELVGDGLPEEYDSWTFMTGLGWWVPNEVADFVVRRLLGEDVATDVAVVRWFRDFQRARRVVEFSEYVCIGRVIWNAKKLLGPRSYDYDSEPWAPRAIPEFQHIPMQPGGAGHHLPPAHATYLRQMIEAP